MNVIININPICNSAGKDMIYSQDIARFLKIASLTLNVYTYLRYIIPRIIKP